MYQGSFRSISKRSKKIRSEIFLDKMEEVMPWRKLVKLINKHIKTTSKQGRPSYDTELMLKIHCLQQWYGLSDPSMEEAIYDRNSFQKFLDLDLLSETVPDETSILKFRHFLESKKLSEKIFKLIVFSLEKKQLILKQCTSVDASIISAPTSTKNQLKQRDPEMSSKKKGNNYYFGMKTHIGVDSKHTLVHSLCSSTAKDNDITKFNQLLHGKEQAYFGDKAYSKDETKKTARASGIFYGILDKGRRGHPLSQSQKKRNKKLSSVRSYVEHPFQVVKNLWGHRKVRYKGLFKNTQQFYMLFALYNIYQVRRLL